MGRARVITVVLLAALLATLLATMPTRGLSAQAAPELPIDVKVLEMVNLPAESPRITLSAGERVEHVRVAVLEAGKRVAGRSIRALGPGGSQTVVWRAQPGVHEYTVQVSGKSDKGAATVSVDTVVTVMRPLEVKLVRQQVDLEERLLFFSMNNPAGRATLSIAGDSGRVMHEATTDLSGRPAGSRLELRWPATDEPIRRMELRVHDASDSWSDFELLPFSVEIPHEDVVFETAAHAIRESETPKLESAYDAILEAIAKHGQDLKARLYVLGHTDTVGSPADNQALSQRRAIAIARWFAERGGISLPILAEGFGEGRLLVKTPDNTDEAKNRRAQYILAAQAPVATDWTTVSTGK
jgi:outer membrane protein OmpA-like peptidoglycan-associated protein